jgi:integrase
MSEKRLTDSQIKRAAARATQYTMNDGGGLFVLVLSTGAKYFQFRYSYAKRQRSIHLGVWPKVSLTHAREQLPKYRKWLSDGHDPLVMRKVDKITKQRDNTGTFGSITEQWIELNRDDWSERNLLRHESILKRVLLPTLGDLPITRIDAEMVYAALLEAQTQRGIATAYEARTTATMIFAYAIARKLIKPQNPARDLPLKPRPAAKSHASLSLDQIGPCLRALKASNVAPVTQAALRLAMLVGVRDNALRHTIWADVDFEGAVWYFPAANMKMRRAFSTPLPRQALAVLRGLHELTHDGPESHVFAGRGKLGHLSQATCTSALKTIGFGPATMHGMRALIATWAQEQQYPRDVVKTQLAHVIGNATDQAYLRSDYWEQRVVLLTHWGATVEALEANKPKPRAKVTRLRADA